jgi:acetyl esterase/lipase
MQEGPGRDDLLSTMFGSGWREDEIKEYNLPENMTENYPPCYIVAAKDDNLVDPKNSEDLKRMLDRYGIPAALEMAEFGGHGWGDGNGSGAAGWPYRAIHFLEHL